jgi:hypothetical protein
MMKNLGKCYVMVKLRYDDVCSENQMTIAKIKAYMNNVRKDTYLNVQIVAKQY